ncbi:hypothetical protein L1077_00340 [Pseudoalteromonas luteoviolacea]|uniref:hypothetical protein n=1 Tax=Pseudoalteromonas luteoviolacea TaxID=43657 RepID=UPI001F3574CB|nr:hypothetical protein [Pseudoalteromonas luteoviolacea]MCF6437881.1 hypothetical protein [Pseudoalteromonas luteoviolacea]
MTSLIDLESHTDVLDTLDKLSKKNRELCAYVNASKARFDRLNLGSKEGSILKELMPYEINALPLIINQNIKGQLSDCVESIPKLVAKMLIDWFEREPNEFAKFYQVNEEIIRKAIHANPLEVLLCRADLTYSNGTFKVLELNVGSNLGGWEVRFFDSLYRGAGTFSDFVQERGNVFCRDPLSEMIKNITCSMVESKRISPDGDCNIVFLCDMNIVSRQMLGFLQFEFIKVCRTSNVQVVPHFIDSIERLTFNNNEVWLGKEKVHCFINPFGSWELGRLEAESQIMESFYAGNVALPENPFSLLINDKRNLGLLWNMRDSHLFNKEEQAQIHNFITWGACATSTEVEWGGEIVELKSLLNNHKNQFVIKPGVGAQGKDVTVGKYTEKAKWQNTVALACRSEGYFIQAYCQPDKVFSKASTSLIASYPVWGAFSFSHTYSGVWVRLVKTSCSQTNGVINTSNGATETLVYEESNRSKLTV